MKKVTLLVSAASLTCCALAQSTGELPTSVNGIAFYGVADVTAEVVYSNEPTGGTPSVDSRTRISSNSSFIGIKGERNLFGGKGLLQLEYGVIYDGQGNGTAGGSSNNLLSVRDSYVGFSHEDFGTIKAGVLSMPMREISGLLNFNPGSTNISDNIPLMATINGINTGFHSRANNSFVYSSPVLAEAYQFKIGYGATEGLVSGPGTFNATGCSSNYPCNPRVTSVGVSWAPADSWLQLYFANERRSDMASSAVNSITDVALQSPNKNEGIDSRLVARFNFGDGFRAALGVDQTKLTAMYGGGAGAEGTVSRSSNSFAVSKTFDQHEFIAYYTVADKLSCEQAALSTAGGSSVCSAANSADTGAKQISLVWHYMYDKQTLLQAYATKISNGAFASYDFDVNPTLNTAFTPGTQRGSNPTGFGVGIRFSF